MNRRLFLKSSVAGALASPLYAALERNRLARAVEVLAKSVESKQVTSAVLHVSQRGETFSQAFGQAGSHEAMFLLGSISKPICVTALMTLFDAGEFKLDDPLKKFIPEFTGDGRETISIKHLLTHTAGLPDQLPNNNELRKSHAPLSEFVNYAIRTPLLFKPGEKYQYASMGILLATHVAEVITGTPITQFVEEKLFKPLGMTRSAQGLGRFQLTDFVQAQTEFGAPESGAGDPTAKDWDWNSSFWRSLGAPWGGTHCSAPDIARWLGDFLHPTGTVLKPETCQLMVRNHNPSGFTPRGLGFVVGNTGLSPGCSESVFGHTGSTGTIAWADPATDTICVILTSLPARAVTPHPRDLAAGEVSRGVNPAISQ